MAYRNYKSNPLNELNINFNKFQNKVKQLAYAHTEEYYIVRERLFASLVEGEVQRIHNMVYNALVLGTNSAGDRNIIRTDNLVATPRIFGGNNTFVPGLSEKEANQIAMSITKGFLSAIETEILDYIMPPEIFEKALMRSANVNRSARA